MELLSVKWLWLYAGAMLMFLELMVPGFVIFFFGLAAATVGLFQFVCEVAPVWQVVLFTFFSIVYLCGLRRFMKSVFMGETAETKRIESEYVGRLGTVVGKISPSIPGRVLLGDAEWDAAASVGLDVGARVRVVKQENLTLFVEPV